VSREPIIKMAATSLVLVARTDSIAAQRVAVKPIMFCLRCGFRQHRWDSVQAKAHRRRCDYTMTIRYVMPDGTVTA